MPGLGAQRAGQSVPAIVAEFARTTARCEISRAGGGFPSLSLRKKFHAGSRSGACGSARWRVSHSSRPPRPAQPGWHRRMRGGQWTPSWPGLAPLLFHAGGIHVPTRSAFRGWHQGVRSLPLLSLVDDVIHRGVGCDDAMVCSVPRAMRRRSRLRSSCLARAREDRR